MITRYIQKSLLQQIGKGKTIIIYGPRQVGKTTLSKYILTQHAGLYINADLINERQRLVSQDLATYTRQLEEHQLIIIDEAQQLPDIGKILKILHDSFPEKQFIATGSSSFEIGQKISEAMTGRTFHFHLLPISIAELYTASERRTFHQKLESYLLFGMYPDVVTQDTKHKKQQTIIDITNAYLFKDILNFEGLKKSDTIVKLAKLLAHQIGQQVSYNELAGQLHISVNTVERYCNILEQAYIIFRLPSFSRNLRKELSKSQKIYFRDTGIRNALIDMFHPIDERGDKGVLRENFVIAELHKNHFHSKAFGKYHFWRTYDQQEIDLIFTHNTDIQGYEIKWSEKQKTKIPKIFLSSYPDSKVQIVTTENILNTLCSKV